MPSIGMYHRSDRVLNCRIGATNRWGFKPWKVFDFPLENSGMDMYRVCGGSGGIRHVVIYPVCGSLDICVFGSTYLFLPRLPLTFPPVLIIIMVAILHIVYLYFLLYLIFSSCCSSYYSTNCTTYNISYT